MLRIGLGSRLQTEVETAQPPPCKVTLLYQLLRWWMEIAPGSISWHAPIKVGGLSNVFLRRTPAIIPMYEKSETTAA